MSAALKAAAFNFIAARNAYFSAPSLGSLVEVDLAADALEALLMDESLSPVVRGSAHNCPKCDDAMECDCTIPIGPLVPPGMAPLRALLDRPGAEL